MKLLLTSGGVRNPSIRAALEELLGKPVEESVALAVPTAQYGHPFCTPGSLHRFVADTAGPSMTGLGWRSVGVLELLALPTMPPERWQPWVREADVLLVDGGEATYLAHWVRASGLGDLLPELHETVWVGVSAGSMVLTPRIGPEFTEWADAPDDTTLGLVDFSIFPHLGLFEQNQMADAERWAAGIGGPAWALDDDSALTVVDGVVEVVSEGEWRRF